MKYKGYEGSVEYSTHDGCFYGKIENIEDLVNYEGQTLEELKNSFHEAVDDYIEFCNSVNKKGVMCNMSIEMSDIWQQIEKSDETNRVAAGHYIGCFVAEIISARHEQGLSQADLAKKIGAPVSRIRRMENLTSMPRIDVVFQAALALGLTLSTPRGVDLMARLMHENYLAAKTWKATALDLAKELGISEDETFERIIAKQERLEGDEKI